MNTTIREENEWDQIEADMATVKPANVEMPWEATTSPNLVQAGDGQTYTTYPAPDADVPFDPAEKGELVQSISETHTVYYCEDHRKKEEGRTAKKTAETSTEAPAMKAAPVKKTAPEPASTADISTISEVLEGVILAYLEKMPGEHASTSQLMQALISPVLGAMQKTGKIRPRK